MPNSFKPGKASLLPVDIFLQTEEYYKQELLKGIRQIGMDNKWLNRYFDLVKELCEELEIHENSKKIVMATTTARKMAITIGQRYIICPKFKKHSIGFILPLEFRDIISDYSNASIDEDFFFDKKGNQEALWVNFDPDIIFSDDTYLFKYWKDAVKVELNRTTLSGFRKSHNPLYYKTVMALNYRQELLTTKDPL